MPKHSDNPLWNRINRLLPRTQDPTLVLLKGHLLIEEQLFAIIAKHCRDASTLEEARLTFVQKLRVAQALSNSLSGQGFPLIQSLKKLNSIRNRMAHHAEIPDLDSRIDEYLRSWDPSGFVTPTTQRERTRYLRNTLIIHIGLLSGIGAKQPTAKTETPI